MTQRFSSHARMVMNNHQWQISPVVRLELQYLYQLGRLKSDADTVISELSASKGLMICDKPFNIVIAHALPLTWTRDPFDRIIVAQASIDDNILISSDATIQANYAFTEW
ncbi:MAG: transposase [Chloroflexota bacterium]